MTSSISHVAPTLIKGCSSGIGRHIAEAALAKGRNVAVTARKPDTVADLVEAHPEQTIALSLDVTDRDQIAAAVAATEQRFGGLDVLVNNAGYGYMAAVEEGEDEEVRAIFDTNYFSVVDMIEPGAFRTDWSTRSMKETKQAGHHRQVLSLHGRTVQSDDVHQQARVGAPTLRDSRAPDLAVPQLHSRSVRRSLDALTARPR